MALTEVGNSVLVRTVSQQYGQAQGEVVSKTYSYTGEKMILIKVRLPF